MTKEEYISLKMNLKNLGCDSEIQYYYDLLNYPIFTVNSFLKEYIWVVINSGMKYEVAKNIYSKVLNAIDHNIPINCVFGHPGKTLAIKYVYENIENVFEDFIKSNDKLAFLESLPWIGKTTKYHLARNLGINVCKPDRHLVRVSNNYGINPFELCSNISMEVGDKVGVVDFVIWRSAVLGLI